jgi:putative flippase GtrA
MAPSVAAGLGGRRLATFIAVGGAATATHFCAALLANRYLGAAPFTANLIGYGAAVSVSYLGHTLLTFRRPVLVTGQFARFMVISLAGLGLSQSITYIGATLLRLPFAFVLIPVITVVPAFSYVASSLWAFAAKRVMPDAATDIPPDGAEARQNASSPSAPKRTRERT